jgi:hypothetical protein
MLSADMILTPNLRNVNLSCTWTLDLLMSDFGGFFFIQKDIALGVSSLLSFNQDGRLALLICTT